MKENIQYYEVRLRFIEKLFKNHQLELLKTNTDKIKNIVDGYNRFKNHINYDSTLAEFPQTFIFN